MSRIKHLTLPIAATMITIIGSALSGATAKELLPFELFSQDKLLHFGCYFVLTFLWANGLDRLRNESAVLHALIISTIVGLVMEVCQFLFFEGRLFEILDIIANISGSLVGALVFIKFIK